MQRAKKLKNIVYLRLNLYHKKAILCNLFNVLNCKSMNKISLWQVTFKKKFQKDSYVNLKKLHWRCNLWIVTLTERYYGAIF